MLKAQPTRSLLTFVSQDMLLVKASTSRNGHNAKCPTGQRRSWYLRLRCSCTRATTSPPPTCRGSCHSLKCAFCARSGLCVKERRRRMRARPWFLVWHVCLELRRLMPAGRPCQVGAGLLPSVHPSPMLCCVSFIIIFLILFFIGLISHMGELKPFLLIRGCFCKEVPFCG